MEMLTRQPRQSDFIEPAWTRLDPETAKDR